MSKQESAPQSLDGDLLNQIQSALEYYAGMRFNREKMEWMPGGPDKAKNALALLKVYRESAPFPASSGVIEEAERLADSKWSRKVGSYPNPEWVRDFEMFVKGADFVISNLPKRESPSITSSPSEGECLEYPKTIYLFGPHVRDVKPGNGSAVHIPAYAFQVNPGYVQYILASTKADKLMTDSVSHMDLEGKANCQSENCSICGEMQAARERIAELEQTEKVYYMNRDWMADAKKRIATLEAENARLKKMDYLDDPATGYRGPAMVVKADEWDKQQSRIAELEQALSYLPKVPTQPQEKEMAARIAELEKSLKESQHWHNEARNWNKPISDMCMKLQARIQQLTEALEKLDDFLAPYTPTCDTWDEHSDDTLIGARQMIQAALKGAKEGEG